MFWELVDHIGRIVYPDTVDCGRCAGSGLDQKDAQSEIVTCETCGGSGRIRG